MILLDLRVHRTSVGRLGRRRHPGVISLQGHATLRAVAWLIAHHALAHGAKVFGALRRLNTLVPVMAVVALMVAMFLRLVMVGVLRLLMVAGRLVVFHGSG